MEVDWELENWLLEVGGSIECKSVDGNILSPVKQLIREFWRFDLHVRNGGVSQYFCNHGLAQWLVLQGAWLPEAVPSLAPIFSEVNRIILGVPDPYLAMLHASPDIEMFYELHQFNVRRELRRLVP